MDALEYVDSLGAQRRFWLAFSESYLGGRRCWYIDVWPNDCIEIGKSPYQARFDELEDGRLQSSSLGNNGNTWARKVGLSEAVFWQVTQRTGRKVVSSRRWVDGGGEWRTDDAERMWRRFECEASAKYHEYEDRFEYRNPTDEPFGMANGFLKEFEHRVPAARPLHAALRAIVHDVRERHYRVALRDEPKSSETVQPKSNQISASRKPNPNAVWIWPDAGTLDSPLNAVWDLAHEWAHVINGPPDSEILGVRAKRLAHEAHIWDSAFGLISGLWDLSSEQRAAFEARREACLGTYR